LKNPRLHEASKKSGFDLHYIENQSPSYLLQLINNPDLKNKLIGLIDDSESLDEFNKLIRNIEKLSI
jgi:hypothetical protein